MKLSAAIQAARPKTLTASLVPCMVVSALAWNVLGHHVQWNLVWYAFASALMIQVGTNYFNDVYDFKKGADTRERIGPRRAAVSNDFSVTQVMMMGALAFLLATAFSIPLIRHGGMPILVLGCASLAAGYLYTAGPFPLAYVGLGEVFVLIFFGWGAVGGLAYLLGLPMGSPVGILATQIGLLSTTLIAINNLRDVRTDALAGKRTLAVRLGESGAKRLIALSAAAPYLIGIGYGEFSWPAVILPWMTAPLTWRLIRNVQRTEPSSAYNQFLGQAAKIQLLFGVCLTLAWIF